MDRPLTTLRQFERWEGFDAKLELDRMVEGRKRFKGELAGVDEGDEAPDGGSVLIVLDGEEDVAHLPFTWIADAKLVMTDELIEESLRRRANEHGDDVDVEEEA